MPNSPDIIDEGYKFLMENPDVLVRLTGNEAYRARVEIAHLKSIREYGHAVYLRISSKGFGESYVALDEQSAKEAPEGTTVYLPADLKKLTTLTGKATDQLHRIASLLEGEMTAVDIALYMAYLGQVVRPPMRAEETLPGPFNPKRNDAEAEEELN
jgi:hypothetical protein